MNKRRPIRYLLRNLFIIFACTRDNNYLRNWKVYNESRIYDNEKLYRHTAHSSSDTVNYGLVVVRFFAARAQTNSKLRSLEIQQLCVAPVTYPNSRKRPADFTPQTENCSIFNLINLSPPLCQHTNDTNSVGSGKHKQRTAVLWL